MEVEKKPVFKSMIGPCYAKSRGLSFTYGQIEVFRRKVILVKYYPILVIGFPFPLLFLLDADSFLNQCTCSKSFADSFYRC